MKIKYLRGSLLLVMAMVLVLGVQTQTMAQMTDFNNLAPYSLNAFDPDEEMFFKDSTDAKTKVPSYVPDELIVKLKEGKTLQDIAALNAQYQVASIKKLFKDSPHHQEELSGLRAEFLRVKLDKEKLDIGERIKEKEELIAHIKERQKRAPQDARLPRLDNIYVLKTAPQADIMTVVSDYSQHPAVEYAEPNYIGRSQSTTPNDSFYLSHQWALRKIEADRAWDFERGSSNVIVAVLDTGVDYNHEDLIGKVIKGYDYVGNDNDPMDEDAAGFGHGTHIAGIISAVTDNYRGIAGLSWNSRILAVRVLNSSDWADFYNLLGIGEWGDAIRYAADYGADVISFSLGLPLSLNLLQDAVDYAYAKGCILVAAAGNSMGDLMPIFPAGYHNVIAVASTDKNDQKAAHSSYGFWVDVSAPGEDIYSTAPGHSYKYGTGTSMAAPHVAGLAALLVSYYPNETNRGIVARIKATTDPFSQSYLTGSGYLGKLGTGRINAYNALTSSTKPFLEVQDVRLQEKVGNGDHIPQSGETMELIVTLENTWQSASSVTANLSASNPYAYVSSIPISYVDFGSIPADNAKDNTNTPFVFTLGAIYDDTPAIFSLDTDADGSSQTLVFQVDLGVRRIPNTKIHSAPHLDSDRIVWEDNSDIYLYDLSTNQEKQITADTAEQKFPRINGSKIVWEDDRNGNWDIYLYDLDTNTEKRITTNSANQAVPDIYENWIVWHDDRHGHWDIYFYDLHTSEERRITTDASEQTFPRINGSTIVWQDKRNGDWDIYYYDLNTNLEWRRNTDSQNPAANQKGPSVSNFGNTIVWQDDRNGNWDIYFYDRNTSTEWHLITDSQNPAANQTTPSISGDTIVWEDDRNGNWDIYLYDRNIEKGRQITRNLADQTMPSISFSTIVWKDGRNKIFGLDVSDCYMTQYGSYRPPVLYPIGNKTVNEGQLLSFTLLAVDLDGDPLTYSASGLPAGATLDASTGVFSWTPTYSQAGSYDVTFIVNGGSLYDFETITITVNNVNRPPVLDFIGNKIINEGANLTFSISATDPDGEPLTYSASGLPSGVMFNTSTGAFSWTPAYSQSGSYNVTFTVSDGSLTDSETIMITVNNVNHPPVLDAIGNRTVNEGSTLTFTVSATDPDGNSLTYSASGLPSGVMFNTSTGAFSWTPTYSQANSYNVNFTVSDGSLTDTETITITVNNVNQAPVLAAIGNKSVSWVEELTFTISATDPDVNPLTYSATGLPFGATFFYHTFSWTPTVSQIGSYNVTFTVSDGILTDSETITITVTGDLIGAPDLIMTSVGISASSVTQSENVTFTGTVKNQGDADTQTEFCVYFYLSPDTIIDPNTDKKVAVDCYLKLATGASHNTTVVMPIPFDLPGGTYYVGAIADCCGGNHVQEGDETNNTLVGNAVSLTVGVDLAMTSFQGPSEAYAGGYVPFQETVVNSGTAPATSCTVSLYLSSDLSITTADIYIGYHFCGDGGKLAPGVSWTSPVNDDIPSNVPAGTYYVGAIADGGNLIQETNEANNAVAGNFIKVLHPKNGNFESQVSTGYWKFPSNASIDQTVFHSGAKSAKLAGVGEISTDAAWPINVTAGKSYKVSGWIKTADIFHSSLTSYGAGMRIRWYSAAGISISVSNIIGNLKGTQDWTSYEKTVTAPAEAVTARFETGIAPSGSGTTGTAWFDDIVIEELYGGSDLAMASFQGPSKAFAGGALVSLKETVINSGTVTTSCLVHYYLSLDSNITAGDTVLGYNSCGDGYGQLAPGVTWTSTVKDDIPPDVAAGTYYWGAIVDRDNKIQETNEANNVIAGNLIQVLHPRNGSFENGKSYWKFPSNASIDQTVFHSGAKSAKLAGVGEISTDAAWPINVTAGKSYKVSGWIKTADIFHSSLTSYGAGMRIRWYSAAGTSISVSNIIGNLKGTRDWASYEKTVTAPASAVTARLETGIAPSGSGTTGTAWFDDIIIEGM